MMRSKSRGFTLIEMVVALTILSLIVLATLTALRTLGQTQARLEERTGQTARIRAVTSFVRRSLEQAHPLRLLELGQPAGHFFYGTSDQLVWAAPLPIYGMQGGLAALNLGVNDQQQLYLQVRDSANLQEWSDEPLYLLADNIQMLELSYRHTPWSEWMDEWQISQDVTAPSHVRIQIRAGDRYWPEIIVAIAQR